MKPSLKDIEWAVCVRYGLDLGHLHGDGRARKYAHPRQVAMYLMRELTGASFPAIGGYFTKDHTTAMHAIRSVRARIAADPMLAAEVAEIVAAIPSNEHRLEHARKWADRLKDGVVSWIAPPPRPVVVAAPEPILEPEIDYTDPLARRLAMGLR